MPTVEALLAETRWLTKLARDLVGDHHAAEDVVQDTLLAALRKRQRPIQKLRPWLQAVARNFALRSRRRDEQRTQVERQSRAAREEALPSAAAAVEQASVHRAVVDAVLRLPEPYRSTIVLRYLEDLPLAEVASRTGVPTETARTRQKRGIAMLRTRLDDRFGGRLAWAAPVLSGPKVTSTTTATTGKTVTTAILLMTAKAKLILATAAVAATVLLLWQLDVFTDSLMGDDELPGPTGAQQQAAVGASTPMNDIGEGERVVLPDNLQPKPQFETVFTGTVVDEETSAPIPGATVCFWEVSGDHAGRTWPGTSTSGSGRFELATHVQSPHDHLELLVRAPDHALTTRSLPSTEADMGEIPVPPGTEVSGRVVDIEGKAVPEAELLVGCDWLFSQAPDGTRMSGNILQLERLLPVGRSGPDGSFVLTEQLLPHWSWTVLVAVHARGVGMKPIPGLSRRRGESKGNVLRLDPPGVLDVEVVDATGKPLPDVLVRAQPCILPYGTDPERDLPLRRDGPLMRHLTRRTDPDGRARFTGLPLDPDDDRGKVAYSLQVMPAGHPAVRRSGILLGPDKPSQVQVRLAGREVCWVHGTVRMPGGVPIAGAQVDAQFGARRTVTTDQSGTYSIQDLPRNLETLYLSVTAAGFAPTRLRRTAFSGQGEMTVDIVLEPGQPLFGIVVDQHGAAVPGVHVRVASAPGLVEKITDEGGMFRFPGVPRGRDQLLVLYPPDPAWGGGYRLEHIATAAMSPLRLTLERPPQTRARLRAQIVDGCGRGVEPKMAQLRRIVEPGHAVWHETEARIGLVTGKDLRPGTWRLQVVPVQGHALERRFVVAAGQELVELRLEQETAGAIEGQVLFDVPAEQRPDRICLQIRTDIQQARWADVPGQPYAAKYARFVYLEVAKGTRFRIIDVDPERPLRVELDRPSGGFVGHGVARVKPGGHAVMEIRAVRCSWVRLRSKVPLTLSEIEVGLRTVGERWGEPTLLRNVRGEQNLSRWPVVPGAVEWRVFLPSRGRSNGSGPRVLSGKVSVAPAATAEVTFDPR